MRLGSLFAGIGGFDLAAERAGLEIAWQSEIDKAASRVLAAHWPDTPNHGDIHDIRADRLAGPAAVDVLTGGFPCQDYSTAGNRGGLAGDRGALWWQYLRLITELRPAWVVGENVPGILTSRDGHDFATIIRSLTECGYGVAWAVLDAQYFGVAQRRRRVFIVGHSRGIPRPEVLALAEGLYGHPRPVRAPGAQTAGDPQNGAREDSRAFIIEPEWGNGADLRAAPADVSPALDSLNSQAHDRDVRIVEDVANSLDTRGPGGRANYESGQLIAVQGGRSTHPNARPDNWLEDGSTYTLNTVDWLNVADSAGVRRLTPLECERLQGFPDGWTDIAGNSDRQRYRQLGNAVAVPVVTWLLARIAAVSGSGPTEKSA